MDEQTNQGILGQFGLFSGKQEFLKKLGSLSFEYVSSSTSCKIWDKSNEPILRKNTATMNKQINRTILGLFDPFLHRQEFSQKIRLCQFWVLIVPQLHAKYKKTNEPILKKIAVVTDKHTNQAILALFGPLSGKQEFSQKIQLHQFWVLMVPQLHAKCQKNPKKQMTQSWVKCCSNGQMDKLGYFRPFGLLLGKREFSQKIRLRQFWILMVPQTHAKYKKTNNKPFLRKML